MSARSVLSVLDANKYEVTQVGITHEGKWLEYEPTGERLEWRNAIFFPWDRAARKFKGEMVYSDLSFAELRETLGATAAPLR